MNVIGLFVAAFIGYAFGGFLHKAGYEDLQLECDKWRARYHNVQKLIEPKHMANELKSYCKLHGHCSECKLSKEGKCTIADVPCYWEV